MSIRLPTHAKVVVIGSGVVGCNVTYHLTKLGWQDVMLLERKTLTSGTSWAVFLLNTLQTMVVTSHC